MTSSLALPYMKQLVEFENDFDIWVYETGGPVMTDAGVFESLFFAPHARTLGHRQWTWTKKNMDGGFHLPLYGMPGTRLVVFQFSTGFGKGRLRSNFRFCVEETGTGTNIKNIFLEKNIRLPRDEVFAWNTVIRGKTALLLLVKTKERRITRWVPSYKVIRRIIPEYPRAALAKRLQGDVTVEVTTDIYGRVMKTGKTTGHPLLIKAAIKAAKQWVIEPYIMSGVPKPYHMTITFHFKLSGNNRVTGTVEASSR